jgi:anti-sigma factor RsiW
MNCAEIHEKVVLAAYGELPDDQAHMLSLHLASCSECREEQEQLLALKTLSAAYPVLEPNANLVARSRTRLEESLDALPPKQWYDRLGDWMTRTATGLQSAPVAACLLRRAVPDGRKCRKARRLLRQLP